MLVKKNKMLGFATFLVVLCLMISSIGLVSAASLYDGEILGVSLVNQEPDPAEPGEYVDIRLKVENSGDSTIEGVQVELMPEFPFSIDSNENVFRDVGTLNPFQKDVAGKILKYKVRVSDSAVEGTSYIKVRFKSDSEDWDVISFPIDVRTNDAAVTITGVEAKPASFSPGEEGVVQIKVQNTADSRMKDVNLKMDLALLSLDSVATLDALPFAPINSVTEKRVSSLKAGEEVVFTYDLKAYPNAAPGVYKIPILLTYEDELQNEFTKEDIIGLVIAAKPDVLITIDDKEFFGNRGTITFKVVNRGLDTAKFATLYLEDSDAYTLESSKENYIGNIDSDDYESVDYDFTFVPGATEVELPVKLTFSDSNNDPYTVSLKLNTHVDLNNDDGSNKNTGGLVIGVAVIAIVAIGIIYWRRKAKKRR